MGPGEGATPGDRETAFQLGKAIAELGYTILTGGRDCGVMEAAMKGAKTTGGMTIGILPGANKEGMSEYTDFPIITNLGNARNSINVLSADIVVAIGVGLGTVSEIMLALKAGKKVIVTNQTQESISFLASLENKNLFIKNNTKEVSSTIHTLLK